MKSRLPSVSLRVQLVISFLIIIVLILLTGYGYFYTESVTTNEEYSQETAFNQFKQIEYQIKSMVNETRKISDLVLEEDNVQNYLKGEFSTQIEEINLSKGIIEYLDSLKWMFDQLQSVFICFESGKVIGIIGSLNTYSSNETTKKSIPFFQSELYTKAKEQYKELEWGLDGEKLIYGERILNATQQQTVKTLTAVRALRGLGEMEQGGTLVINIDESTIKNTYKFLTDSKHRSIYIVDENDIMISHAEQSLIGIKESLFHTKDLKGQFGNFSMLRNGDKNKFFYYKIDDPNWTIISETPLNEYEKNANLLRIRFLLILAISILIAFLLANFLMSRLTKPIRILKKAMNNIESGKLGHVIEKDPQNEIRGLITSFNRMSESLVELIEKNKLNEEKKREYEVEALRSQINPHFIFNTLNIIKWMAIVQKCNSVSDAISTLANIIGPLFKDKNPICTIEQEMNYIENYVKIVNLRFGNGMSILFDFPEEVKQYKILRFSLQPVIENSILHGFENTLDNSSVLVSTTVEEEAIIITIEDNGKGIDLCRLEDLNKILLMDHDDYMLNRSGIGLVNVNQRIKLHFGNNFGISIHSRADHGTIVYVRFPKIK